MSKLKVVRNKEVVEREVSKYDLNSTTVRLLINDAEVPLKNVREITILERV